MAASKLKGEDVKKKVTNKENDTLTVVDFYADWCGPCKQLSPIIDEIAGESEGVVICKVDVDDDDNRDFVVDCQVVSIPTVVFFKGGEMVHQFVGLQDKNTIVDLIAKYK